MGVLARQGRDEGSDALTNSTGPYSGDKASATVRMARICTTTSRARAKCRPGFLLDIDVFRHAIDLAQAGGKYQDAKVMTGFGSAGVLEVVEDDRGDTYRAVYTVKFAGWVYVLHCFQKKSKSGIKTPKADMDLIHARLKAAKLDFDAWQTKQGAR